MQNNNLTHKIAQSYSFVCKLKIKKQGKRGSMYIKCILGTAYNEHKPLDNCHRIQVIK